VSARDRITVSAVVALAALAGFWFLVLAPKREQVAAAGARLTAQQQRLDSARTVLANVQGAKRRYAADYAEIVRLAKAVPGDDDTASLLYELQSVANGAKVRFDSMKLTAATAGSPASAVASGSATAGTSGAGTGAAAPTGTAAAATGAATAPATQVGAAALPPGATVGTAGLATMPFSFVFEGRYLDMQRFLGNVDRFVAVRGDRIDVRGRLLALDGLSLTTTPDEHGLVKASISATAYVAPHDGAAGPAGPAAGATPAPSAGTASGTGSNTSSAVPAATNP
jgi:Tfp pilus assembly protein PilO